MPEQQVASKRTVLLHITMTQWPLQWLGNEGQCKVLQASVVPTVEIDYLFSGCLLHHGGPLDVARAQNAAHVQTAH